MTLSTERLSWRGRLHRILVRIAVGTFVLVCLIYLCEYAVEWRRRERLEALVQSIKSLQVGVTPDEEVRALSERYGGRFAPEGTFTEPRTSTFSVDFSSPYIRGADGFHTLPGRRLWMADVELVITDRRLIRTFVRFMVMRSDGYVLMSGIDEAQRSSSYPPEWARYEVFEPHYTGDPNEGLKVLLSPEATPAEKDKAFHINFACLTALRECRHPCDVLPEAWHDLRSRHPSERSDSMDADCRQSKP